MIYSNDALYSNEAPADLRKRTIASFLDGLFIVLTHFLVFFLATLIYNNTPICRNKQDLLNSSALECNRLQEDAHLYEFTGQGEDKYSSHKSEDSVYYTWIQEHIKLSFTIDPSYFIEQGVTSLDKLDEGINDANFSNDHLGYFFHDFINRRNEELKVVTLEGRNVDEFYQNEVFIKLAKNYPLSDGTEEIMWVYDNVTYSLPHLTSKAAYHIYAYQKLGKQDAVNTLYNKLARTTYSSIWTKEKDLLMDSSGFRLYYDVYLANYHSMVLDIDTCSILSFLLTFVAVYYLPTLFSKNHVSLGKKITHVMIVDIDGVKMNKKQYLLRPIFKLFNLFGLTLISNMFCQGLNSAWMRPMFYLGSFEVSLLRINLLFIIIAVISLVVLLINRSHCSIADLALRTYVIDEVDDAQKEYFHKEREKNLSKNKNYVER